MLWIWFRLGLIVYLIWIQKLSYKMFTLAWNFQDLCFYKSWDLRICFFLVMRSKTYLLQAQIFIGGRYSDWKDSNLKYWYSKSRYSFRVKKFSEQWEQITLDLSNSVCVPTRGASEKWQHAYSRSLWELTTGLH